MSPEEGVTIAINWHELHILTVWAENWASRIKNNPDVTENPVQTVFAIAKRLQDQYPLLGPLTLSGEIESLKQDSRFKTIETHGIESGGPVSGGDNEIG